MKASPRPDGKVTCCLVANPREHSFVNGEKRKLWFCNGCKKQFTLKVATVFEDSALGLDKWMAAFWMLVNCKNGISSYELHRSLGVSQKSAWFMLHRIREAMRAGSIAKMGGPEGGPVEVDETFVGARYSPDARQQTCRKRKLGTHYKLGIPVMGMLDRELRQVRAKVVPNVKRETLQNEILNHIEKKSTIYTDGYPSYDTYPLSSKLRSSFTTP